MRLVNWMVGINERHGIQPIIEGKIALGNVLRKLYNK
jgi:hypothetical protein